MAWSLDKTIGTPKPKQPIPAEPPAWESTVPKAPAEQAGSVRSVKADIGEEHATLRKAAGIKNPLFQKSDQLAVTRPRGIRYGGLLSK